MPKRESDPPACRSVIVEKGFVRHSGMRCESKNGIPWGLGLKGRSLGRWSVYKPERVVSSIEGSGDARLHQTPIPNAGRRGIRVASHPRTTSRTRRDGDSSLPRLPRIPPDLRPRGIPKQMDRRRTGQACQLVQSTPSAAPLTSIPMRAVPDSGTAVGGRWATGSTIAVQCGAAITRAPSDHRTGRVTSRQVCSPGGR